MNFTKTDFRFWEKAKEISKESTFRQFHIGCVAVYRNQIVATGVNSYKTHPIQHEMNFLHRNLDFNIPNSVEGLHAEMACILELSRLHPNIRWEKVKLYIYRETKDEVMASCRPCEACTAVIREKGIRKVYYTSDEGYVYEEFV